MLEIQKFIDEYDDIELANHVLRKKLKLEIKKDFLWLKQLKREYVYLYNTTDYSPEHHPIVNEANGLILSSLGNIICRTMPVIYPINNITKPVDWESAEVEKIPPGIPIILYFHINAWNISTHHDVNAMEKFNPSESTYINKEAMDYLTTINGILDVNFPFDHLEKHKCYFCVFNRPFTMQPANRSVSIQLMSIIDKHSGAESDWEELNRISDLLGIRAAKKENVNNEQQARILLDYTPSTTAGIIINEKNNGRIYILKEEEDFMEEDDIKAKENLKSLTKAVILGTGRDMLLTHKDYYAMIFLLLKVRRDLAVNLRTTWEANRHLKTAEYVNTIKEHKFKDLLINLYTTPKTRVNEQISRITVDRYLDTVEEMYSQEFKETKEIIKKMESI